MCFCFFSDNGKEKNCTKSDLSVNGTKIETGQDVIVKEGEYVMLSLCRGGESDNCDIDLKDEMICRVKENSEK